MKIYIKSERELRQGQHSYHIPYDVEVLGNTPCGNLEVYFSSHDNRYWVGHVPYHKLWANAYPLDYFGINTDNMSDEQIISAVDSQLRQLINTPVANEVSKLLSIDLASMPWTIYSSDNYIIITMNVEDKHATFKIKLSDGHVVYSSPCAWFFHYLAENNILIDDVLKKTGGYQEYERAESQGYRW